MVPISILGRTFLYLQTSAWLKGHCLWRSLMTGNRGGNSGLSKLKHPVKSRSLIQNPPECSLIQTAQMSRAVIPKWLCCMIISGHYLLDKYWRVGREEELFLSLSYTNAYARKDQPSCMKHAFPSLPLCLWQGVSFRRQLWEKRKMLSNVEGQKQLKAPQIVKLQRTLCGWVWFRGKKQEDGRHLLAGMLEIIWLTAIKAKQTRYLSLVGGFYECSWTAWLRPFTSEPRGWGFMSSIQEDCTIFLI